MSEHMSRRLLIAQVAILLTPLTLVILLMLLLAYPAYPIPNVRPVTLLFDLAILWVVGGIVAAWYLGLRRIRSGPAALRMAHAVWALLLAVGALIGLIGAAFALQHALTPRTAADQVGFALLAPAAALVPVALHLAFERRRAGN